MPTITLLWVIPCPHCLGHGAGGPSVAICSPSKSRGLVSLPANRRNQKRVGCSDRGLSSGLSGVTVGQALRA